jgi:protease-4
MKTNPLFAAHVAEKKLWAADATSIIKVATASIFDDIKIDDFFTLRKKPYVENGVGHVAIQGLLTNGLPPLYEKLGYVTSYDSIKAEIEQVITEGALAIQLEIESGGGSVNGAIELSRYIASLPIPTGAKVQGCACSAAYMIASATNRIEISETAMIGNIGTIISWYDYTGMLRDMGIEPKAITNEGATLKSTFHLEPNAEQLAFLQESANQHGETFKSFVASRRDVDDEVFRAGWYSGNRALELGLADAIFDTI